MIKQIIKKGNMCQNQRENILWKQEEVRKRKSKDRGCCYGVKKKKKKNDIPS